MSATSAANPAGWTAPRPSRPSPLDGDRSCDVVVIGAGIAGLSTAYELSRFGRAVIVIDRGGIGRGMTARTTAHLATELDDFYSELIRTRGEEEARLYYDSQVGGREPHRGDLPGRRASTPISRGWTVSCLRHYWRIAPLSKRSTGPAGR